MLKKILLGVVAVIVVFVVVVLMQPADFQVVRSAKIAAPPADVFSQVNDFHNWQAWSPWAKLDPAAKKSFEGPNSGTGAKFAWAGNNDIGEGKMTIVESHPSDRIQVNLEFIKPFAANNQVEFTFKPEGDQTNVTWTMSGRNNFIGKAMCMFMNMDKMVGGDFEKGLANLKSVVESGKKKGEPADAEPREPAKDAPKATLKENAKPAPAESKESSAK